MEETRATFTILDDKVSTSHEKIDKDAFINKLNEAKDIIAPRLEHLKEEGEMILATSEGVLPDDLAIEPRVVQDPYGGYYKISSFGLVKKK